MRIGLLGGTFNPVHNGHLALAEGAMEKLRLDKVIFIPAHISPHKAPDELIAAEERFKMIELAIDKRPNFEISRFEIEKQEKSYSIKTLEYFTDSYPKDTDLFFLIGADSFEGLTTWKDIDKVARLCRFAVCNRPNFSKETKHLDVEKFDIAPVYISSTDIRKRIKNAEPISGLLPQAVEDYIKKSNLYK